MAVRFASASGNRVYNDVNPKILAYPFTIAMWARPAGTASTNALWSASQTAVTNHYYAIEQNGSTSWQIVARGGGTENAGSATGAPPVANVWFFIVARFIGATNRRIAVLSERGLAGHAQTTTNRTATGIVVNTLGAKDVSGGIEYWDGDIAEFWYANADIQADGAQLVNSTLWQLAYGGPFSLPHIAHRIVEYRAMRSVISDQTYPHARNEIYWSGPARPNWTSQNILLCDHKPLPGYYEGPDDARRIGIV